MNWKGCGRKRSWPNRKVVAWRNWGRWRKTCQDSRSLDWDKNWGPLEREVEVLPTQSVKSYHFIEVCGSYQHYFLSNQLLVWMSGFLIPKSRRKEDTSTSRVQRCTALKDYLKLPEWLALLLRIREVSGSNLSPETSYLDWGFSYFSSVPPRQMPG
jgi:hypothetical protein